MRKNLASQVDKRFPDLRGKKSPDLYSRQDANAQREDKIFNHKPH